jgi:hypothetical protein
MAILHITYKHDPQTSTPTGHGVCTVLKSYHYVRFSESNWAIDTEELPKNVWRKLKCYIDPNDYLVMMPIDRCLLTPQDWKTLKWLLSRL